MLKRLHELAGQGVLRRIDYQFAKFVALQTPEPNASLSALAAALVSNELGKGHVCLDLKQISEAHLFGLSGKTSAQLLEGLSKPGQWPGELAQLPVVSDSSNVKPTPLVLDGSRLYLHRYWQFEKSVAGKLHHLSASEEPDPIMPGVLNKLFPRAYGYLYQSLTELKNGIGGAENTFEQRLKVVRDKLDLVPADGLDWDKIDTALSLVKEESDLTVLDKLIPQSVCLNWQKVAAAMAVCRQFSVISGGPGTGKTTTVAKLLAALVMQADRPEGGRELTIKLVAPTGKAATRLTESIGTAVASLESLGIKQAIRDRIPTQSSTIHRLLGTKADNVDFRHNSDNPLHLDVLVVDEASMVDLPMMARLLDALPPHAKLILLGDRNQLASVEAGAVLGDICAFTDQGYSHRQAQSLSQLTGFNMADMNLATMQGELFFSPVADSLCMLKKSYRFHAESGIGKLAEAINNGKPSDTEKVFQQGYKDIRHCPLSADSYKSMINTTVTFYRDYFDAIEQKKKPEDVLRAFSRVRLLCALREGDFGVDGLNRRIERELVRIGKISKTDETWYEGRPVMITRNDHGLELYNGDIGIVMNEEDEGSDERNLRVFFEMPDGSVRSVLPSRLPEHETVYAMTIHKSQGSEFEDTLMVLPAESNPVLTRELVYTGVTRAKERLHLYAKNDVIRSAVGVKTKRNSGLSILLGL